MEENSILINNKNNFQEIISNMEQSIETMILYRSLYLIKKKFEIYKSNINKIYIEYNINKSKRIDAFGSYQIDINCFEEIIILILKELNLFILKLTSPKDIFLSNFLITNQKLEEMSLIIRELKKEIIEKELIGKYNRIFYDKKIKPLFHIKPKINIIIDNNDEDISNENNDNGEEITKEKTIIEYNKRGKIVKTFDTLINENENNIKEFQNQIKEKEICYMENNNIRYNDTIKKSNNSNNNILFVETVPLIIADYFQEHKDLAIVEIEEELSKELDLLFNKDLLIKINEYDEFINKYKNYNNTNNIISKELKQYSLQLKQIQKNIKLYEQIIIDKKIKSENTIFLEDMLNRLIEKETLVQQKINEKKQNAYIINSNEKNNIQNKIKNYNIFNNLDFSPIKSININNNSNNIIIKNDIHKLSIKNKKVINENKITNKIRYNSPSILITNQSNNIRLNTKNSILNNTPKKIILSSELSEEQIQKALMEIFSFYSCLNSENKNNNNNDINNKYVDINNYNKFCGDFKIKLSKPKINEIFKKSCGDNNNSENDNLLKMNYNQFKSSLITISLEMHSIKKQKLLKNISEKKNIMNYLELKECQRQEEEKNHNKLTEKITGGIAKKALEKNQYDFISKHKKLNEDIIKYEFDYEKESKKNDLDILNNFYKYLGINSNYKTNMKNTKMNAIYGHLKNIKEADIQTNGIQTIKERKIDIENNLYLSKQHINNNISQNNQIINKNELTVNYNHINENGLMKISSSSKKIISKNKLFENSNKINWNQMQNIYFDYNPIYENNHINNDKFETDSDEEIIKKLNKSRNRNKLVKNFSAIELKGINKDNILPLIKSNTINNNQIENNLRYYN